MPVYEYFCQKCDNEFDVKASMSEKEKGLKVKCPSCGSAKTVQVMTTFFSSSKKGSGSGGRCGPDAHSGCCG